MSDISSKALHKISLHRLMDLKIDYAFKQLFGSEKNKDITVVFLNAILQRHEQQMIQEITFINQEMGGEHFDDKQSRLDIVVRTQDGTLINVEIQLANQHDMVKRTLYYWARLYGGQLKAGQGYFELLPTITINICNFTIFPQLEKYHSVFRLFEKELQHPITDANNLLELHFIEMNKFLTLWHEARLKPLEDILARWLLLLGMVDARKQKVYNEIYDELEALALNDKDLRQAFGIWEELSMSKEEAIAYQSRLKYILDEEAKYAHARHEGREEGREEGKEQGEKQRAFQIAKALLADQMEEALILKYTGLSEQELQQIK